MVCATSKASDQPAHTRSLIRAFASRLNILLLTELHLEFLSLNEVHMLVWVYTCQNATLLEITCHGSFKHRVVTCLSSSQPCTTETSLVSYSKEQEHARIQIFFQRGSNFFLVNEWIQISLKSGHHRPATDNGVSLVCRWWPNIECWLGSFVIFRGSGPVLLRNPIFLWFFRGGPDPLSPTSGSAHEVACPFDVCSSQVF